MHISPQGRRGLLVSFLVSMLIVNLQSLYAQTPPFSFEEIEVGEPEDEREHELYYGDSTNPVEAVASIQIVYDYDDSPILASSTLTLIGGDWFTDDNGWEGTVSLDTAAREISVSLSRTDNVPVGGYGLLVTVGGIIIDIDDIHKRNDVELKLKSLRINSTSAPLVLYPNPAIDRIFVKGLEDAIHSVEILDMQGKKIPVPAIMDNSIHISHLPAGMYTVQIRSESERLNKRIVIQK